MVLLPTAERHGALVMLPTHEYLQPVPLRPQVAQRPLDPPRQPAQPPAGQGKARVTSLFLDRFDWTADQHRAAAAALGHEAGLRLLTLDSLIRSGFGHSDYEQGMLADFEREARDLARQAAYYAGCAIELDAVEAGTLGGAVR